MCNACGREYVQCAYHVFGSALVHKGVNESAHLRTLTCSVREPSVRNASGLHICCPYVPSSKPSTWELLSSSRFFTVNGGATSGQQLIQGYPIYLI